MRIIARILLLGGRIPHTTRPRLQPFHARRLGEGNRRAVRHGQRLGEEVFKIRPDPEDKPGVLNHTHVRRPQTVGMRGRRPADQKRGRTHPAHHPRRQRMQGFYGDHDFGYGSGSAGKTAHQ